VLSFKQKFFSTEICHSDTILQEFWDTGIGGRGLMPEVKAREALASQSMFTVYLLCSRSYCSKYEKEPNLKAIKWIHICTQTDMLALRNLQNEEERHKLPREK
jgi:hypothetical protein